MARKRDISLTLALCMSLTAHAWIVRTIAEQYSAAERFPWLPSLWRERLNPPAPIAVAPVPKPLQPKEDEWQLGQETGQGPALADSEGDVAQQAKQAEQEQASLSLDPEGNNGKQAAPPSPQVTPPTPVFAQRPSEQAPAEFAVPGSEPPVALVPARSESEKQREQVQPQAVAESPTTPELDGPSQPRNDQPQEAEQSAQYAQLTPSFQAQTQARPVEEDKPLVPPTAAPQQPAINTKNPQRNESQQAQPAELPGDPAPLADTESDAFSTEPSVDFVRGKTIARQGRKSKLVTPKIEMAGYADMLQLSQPIIVRLRITTDTVGNVVKVDIIKSSGSINIDQPTKQAAYKWWFEPPRDKNGKPLADTFDFTGRFR